MRRLPLLLRAALLLCPGEFRAHCAGEIAADLDPSRPEPIPLLRACIDIACTGLALHAENSRRDFVFAVRMLLRSPIYTLVATLAIALAIGANLAVASVLQGVLLRPLPYPDGNRLVSIGCESGALACSYLDARDFAAQQHTLSSFGVRADDSLALTGIPVPVQLSGSQVDDGYFHVLSARAELGRLFARADLGRKRVVLSDAAWRTYFNGDRSILGRTVMLDATAYTVVGIAPASLRDLTQQEGLAKNAFWIPIDPRAKESRARGMMDFEGWGVLDAGTSFAAAQADARRVMNAIEGRFPVAHPDATPASVVGALDLIVGPVRQMLWLLYAAVSVLLIIACANIVNLTLVRAAARERELVVRSALGATRARIAVQLCTEMGVIALGGGIAGIALGCLGLRLFSVFGAGVIPRWDDVRVNAGAIGYVAAIALAATIVTGVMPALMQRRDLAAGLKAAGRSGDASGAKRLRVALVVAEIGLTVGLMICAGLTLRSFVALTHVSLGFDPSRLYAVSTPSDSTQKLGYAVELRNDQRVLDAVRGIPSVAEASMATLLPFSDADVTVGTTFPGKPGVAVLHGNAVGPSYFHVMGIPLLRGRAFTPADDSHAPAVAIVTAALARRYFGTLDVIGRQISPGFTTPLTPTRTRTIVGVVGDARAGFDQSLQPGFYLPSGQLGAGNVLAVRLRTTDPHFAAEVHAVYRRLNQAYPAPEVVSFNELFAQNSGRWQGAALLFGVLACIALLLAVAGIYAVTAYSVQQRTREFGIRKAIGATEGHVLKDVVAGALRHGALGAIIGLAIAAAGARALGALLFNVSPVDPPTYGGVVALVLACTVCAALVPALRAMRVEAAAALRYE